MWYSKTLSYFNDKQAKMVNCKSKCKTEEVNVICKSKCKREEVNATIFLPQTEKSLRFLLV